MKAKEFNEDRFGKRTPNEHEIARKHGVSIVTIYNELDLGMDAELEHTDDEDIAREIALDHLNELPDCYSRLKRMETASKVDTFNLTFEDLEDIIVRYAEMANISEYELLARLQRSFGNEE